MATTRYLGLCPVCMRDIKVQKGKLVHHGYQRPGYGYIEGDCFGVHRPPFETTDATAREWLQVVIESRQNTERSLKRLPDQTSLPGEKYDGESRKYVPVMIERSAVSGYEWKRLRESVERQLTSKIHALRGEEQRLREMIDAWVQKPLREVEEEKAMKAAEKSARASALKAKRMEKIQAAAARLTKKTDQLVTKLQRFEGKDLTDQEAHGRLLLRQDLVEVFTRGPNKLQELSGFSGGEYGITRDEARALIDRDAVWERVGLLPGKRTPDQADLALLRLMGPDWRASLSRRDAPERVDRLLAKGWLEEARYGLAVTDKGKAALAGTGANPKATAKLKLMR